MLSTVIQELFNIMTCICNQIVIPNYHLAVTVAGNAWVTQLFMEVHCWRRKNWRTILSPFTQRNLLEEWRLALSII